jgi:ATP-binding cassette subfamily B multidrug efflux pump
MAWEKTRTPVRKLTYGSAVLIRLLRVHLSPYTKPLTLIVLLQLVQTLATLYLPTLNADIIDTGVVKGNTGYILSTGGWMLAVTLAQILCSIGAVYFGARTAMALGRDIRASVFDQVQSFSAREMGQFGAPSLITRTTNDVQQVQMLVLMAFTTMVSAPIMCIGGIVMALNQDVPLSLLLLIIVPILGILISLIVRRMRPLFRGMQQRIDGVNRILREQITGIRVIRAFVRDTHERERFARANNELLDVSIRTGRLMSMMFPLVMLVVNASSIAILWFGGERINSGHMYIGALTAFLSYLMQILMSVMMATFMFMMVPRAEVCAERIQEVLSTDTSVVPPVTPIRSLGSGSSSRHGRLGSVPSSRPDQLARPEASGSASGGSLKERRRSEAKPKTEEAVLRQPTPSAGDAGGTSQQRSCLGEHRRPTTTQETEPPGHASPAGNSEQALELRDVEFRYPGAEEPVLKDIAFTARPGETTAVIGSTGSGKSTLISLIPRLFDTTAGAVLINGVDVRELDSDVLAAAIGLVPQKPYLFNGTVASNLRYGKPDATDDELWNALDIAQARDFVEKMPEGLDAPITQGGSNVSGGQRQRLAIARALVSRPQIYLFDDSFSALDYATDARLRAALACETGEATVVIVAQRVGTIRDADRIIVLDEGRIVGTGTHTELMADNETYREIVLSQLTEEEAA